MLGQGKAAFRSNDGQVTLYAVWYNAPWEVYETKHKDLNSAIKYLKENFPGVGIVSFEKFRAWLLEYTLVDTLI